MVRKGWSLADIQDAPKENLTLLVAPPGAGKSNFCHQVVLNGIASERPIIFVTTEQHPSGIVLQLKEKGLGEPSHIALNFVDAYAQTVGLAARERSDTITANCEDLNSINMAIAKQKEIIGKENILLTFDSLTSPYLFNKEEVIRFLRLSLSKFAAEGNSVLALMDEGCGKEEDMVAMMSVADVIIRMEMKDSTRIISIVKHPVMAPIKIETPITWSPEVSFKRWDPELIGRIWSSSFNTKSGQAIRKEVGDFVNMFWRNLAFWSGMLWDPKRLPTTIYNLNKEDGMAMVKPGLQYAPWRMRFFMNLFIPKSFNKVIDFKKISSRLAKRALKDSGDGIWEYLPKESKNDEHYVRLYENSWCWGFDNVGARLSFGGLGQLAGILKGLDKDQRDWNIVETMCIGTGSPYCEFKVVPGDTNELKDYLESIDSTIVERIHGRLMGQLTGYVIRNKPLAQRPRLGSGISFNQMFMATGEPGLFSERYRMALRMGGAKVGKETGECLMDAGLKDDEVIKRIIDFMNHCKAGKITMDNTIRMKENCETFGVPGDEPSCFFTTGFLNGLFSVTKEQHIKEVKCIATGEPYCEWEIV